MSTILSVNAHSFFSTVKFIVYMRATQHQQQKSKPPTHCQQLFWYISKNINRWILILIIPVYYSYLITIYTRGMYCCCDYQLSFQLLILLLRNISQLKHHNVISMSYHEISCKSNVGIIEIYWWKSSFSNILLLLLLLLLLRFFFWEKMSKGKAWGGEFGVVGRKGSKESIRQQQQSLQQLTRYVWEWPICYNCNYSTMQHTQASPDCLSIHDNNHSISDSQ